MPAPLEYTMVIAAVDLPALGVEYEKVPPHITVLPWMDISRVEDEFMSGATAICENSAILAINPFKEILVGPASDIPAQQVKSDGLILVHHELFDLAEDLGVRFQNPEWLGEGYNPHLTEGYLSSSLVVRALVVIFNAKRENSNRGKKVVSAVLPLGQNL